MCILQSWGNSLRVIFSRKNERSFFGEAFSRALRTLKLCFIYGSPFVLSVGLICLALFIAAQQWVVFLPLLCIAVFLSVLLTGFLSYVLLVFGDRITAYTDVLTYCRLYIKKYFGYTGLMLLCMLTALFIGFLLLLLNPVLFCVVFAISVGLMLGAPLFSLFYLFDGFSVIQSIKKGSILAFYNAPGVVFLMLIICPVILFLFTFILCFGVGIISMFFFSEPFTGIAQLICRIFCQIISFVLGSSFVLVYYQRVKNQESNQALDVND